MIVQEIIENGLIRTYSDDKKMIIQNETGALYEEAIDIPGKYTYSESDIDIETYNEE